MSVALRKLNALTIPKSSDDVKLEGNSIYSVWRERRDRMLPNNATRSPNLTARTNALVESRQFSVYQHTDRLFAALMLCQWLGGIVISLSPLTSAGQHIEVHRQVLSALVIGGLIIFCPVYLAIVRPGSKLTRHAIAVGQMFFSALLFHLTGGRIETQFHVLGSLAFLSFYNDWRVIVSASIVVALNQFLGAYFFPLSVYGITAAEPWRWIEYAWWVVFEDIFLINLCLRNVKDARSDSFRQAEVEAMNDNIEQQVGLRTAELTKATAMVELQCSVARILAETDTWNDAAEPLIGTISNSLSSGCERAWAAYWSFNEDRTLLVCTKTQQFPINSVDQLESASKNVSFIKGQGLPGRVWEANRATQIRNILTDDNLPRLRAATNAGLSSALAFPVIDGDSMIGVLEFFADREFVLDEPTMEIMQSLGRQIGQFIVRRQTEQERRRLASIVEHSNDAIFSKCNSDIIRSWNEGARRLFGYTQEEAIGQHLSVLVPLDKVFELQELDTKVSTGERITDLETQRVSKSGERIDVSLSRAPLFDDRGDLVGSSITARDIRERKQAERRVKEFYSMVSHELRAPLTSIRGSLGLLENGVVVMSSSEATDLLQMARESTDRLIRLINHILDLKKIESGNMKLQRTPVDIEQVVSTTLAALRGMADERSTTLVADFQVGGLIYADKDKTVQIFTNLLSNAIKFSPRNATVKVQSTAPESGLIRFSVTDSGPGISPEDISKLFFMFQQLDSSDSRNVEGTGLGLAICKAYVEQHGGIIGVSSEPGNGSTFWFELPAYTGNEGDSEPSTSGFAEAPSNGDQAVVPL